jgi:hypothetical protein
MAGWRDGNCSLVTASLTGVSRRHVNSEKDMGPHLQRATV